MYDEYDPPSFGPAIWDATPGVCCAYFQTGACSHTEDYDWDEAYAANCEDDA